MTDCVSEVFHYILHFPKSIMCPSVLDGVGVCVLYFTARLSMRMAGVQPMEQTMKKMYILMVAVATAMLADAAAPAFEKVPDAARTALKGARGRPVRKGFVFVNGHYLQPPYTVARYGTAIFINDIQVSGQIVSWKAFLSTQTSGMPTATPAAAPTPAKKTSAIDDLFDDDAPAKQSAPAAADTGSDSGAFVSNARSMQMLKRINDYRTDINKRLLNGEACFFGSRYARVNVPQRLGRSLMDVLPEAIRDSADGNDLYRRMRGRGFVFLNAALCADLVENRADYSALAERRQAMKEDAEVQNMLSTGGQGITP